MSCYDKQSLMIFLIDLSRDFQSIREISFIISLYLILLISVVKDAKKNSQIFLGTKRANLSCQKNPKKQGARTNSEER